jgi:hypothetical protein
MRVNSKNCKIFILLAMTAMLGFGAMAQDVITLKDGNEIEAVIQKVGINKVKYKKWDNPTGPVYIMKKSEVIMVQYPNGSIDVFDDFFYSNNSDAKTKPFAALSVASDRMNILYAGIPNPVSVAASVNPKKLRISWGGATAIYRGNGNYEISVSDSLESKEVIITVSAKKSGKIQYLESVYFRVKTVPGPVIIVGGYLNGGSHPKDAILANPFVSAKWTPDFHIDARWTVLSYNVIFIINGIVEPTITVEGGLFSEQVLDKIKNAPSGTIITFSDFKIQSIAGYREIENLIVVRIQ